MSRLSGLGAFINSNIYLRLWLLNIPWLSLLSYSDVLCEIVYKYNNLKCNFAIKLQIYIIISLFKFLLWNIHFFLIGWEEAYITEYYHTILWRYHLDIFLLIVIFFTIFFHITSFPMCLREYVLIARSVFIISVNLPNNTFYPNSRDTSIL